MVSAIGFNAHPAFGLQKPAAKPQAEAPSRGYLNRGYHGVLGGVQAYAAYQLGAKAVDQGGKLHFLRTGLFGIAAAKLGEWAAGHLQKATGIEIPDALQKLIHFKKSDAA